MNSTLDTPRFNNESTYSGGSTNDDGIGIELPDGTEIDQAGYGFGYNGLPDFPAMGTAEGTSVQLNANALDFQSNDAGANWRASVATYGDQGFLGTPGTANFGFDSGVRAPGDIIVTEIMIDPNGSEGQTEWFEVYNTTDNTIDLVDWVIGDVSSSSRPHKINASVVVASKDYALLAISADPAVNRNLPAVDYAYGFFSPINPGDTQPSGDPFIRFNNESSFNDGDTSDNEVDGITLTAPSGVEIDRVLYDFGYGTNPIGFPAQNIIDDGASIELGFSYFNSDANDLPEAWEFAISDYSSNDDFGTPGAANDFNRVYTYDGAWQAPFGDINSSINPTQDLIILSGTATVTAQIPVRNIQIQTGATLNTTTASGLIINGSTLVDGTLTGVTGSGIAFQGNQAQTLSGAGLVNVSTFGVENPFGVTTSVDVEVRDGLAISLGNLTNAGSFTLKDHTSGSSRIAAIPETSLVTGNFKVEKYLSAATSVNSSGKAFRFIASPVTSTGPIFDNWQASGINIANQGTHITGTRGTIGNIDATTGFDETASGASSLFSFSNDSSQSWIAATSTNQAGDKLKVGIGYRLFVRGDRDQVRLASDVNANATTLTVEGELAIGDQNFTYPVLEDEFVLFGNPYQSPIEIESVLANSFGVDPDLIYYWDPNIGGDNGRGGYVLVRGFAAGGTETVQPTSTSSNSMMRAGESAFVIAETGATNMVLNFSESDKQAINIPAGIAPKSGSTVERIVINLYDTPSFNNAGTPSDAVSFDYNLGAAEKDLTNIIKLYNQDESFVIKGDGVDLAVKSLSEIVDGTTIPLAIYNYGDSDYTFNIDVTSFEGFAISIQDNVLNESTLLSNGAANRFDFSVADGETSNSDRFNLVFSKNTLSNNSDEIAGLTLYPNPTNGVNIYITGLEPSMVIETFNSLGQKLGSISADKLTRNGLDTFAWSTGIYFVKVSVDDKSKTFKVVRK